MLNVGVVLSGCGFKDGSEIQEAVFTLYHLDSLNTKVLCMAPNINQSKVVNHITGESINETRNVLIESSRISRGDIKDIQDVNIKELDAIIFPGGFGAAMNLSDLAEKGADLQVNPQIENVIKEFYNMKKPIGFICISPAVASKVLGNLNTNNKPKLTIGNDKGTAEIINKMGCQHIDSPVDNIVVYTENKIVSTPAYMYDSRPSEVFKGIEKLVKEVVSMAQNK